MTPRPSLIRLAAEILLGYAIFELYMALRPDNLTDEINRYLETSRGRFASFYAERQRRNAAPPEGFDD